MRNDSLRSDGSIGSSGGGTKQFLSNIGKNFRKSRGSRDSRDFDADLWSPASREASLTSRESSPAVVGDPRRHMQDLLDENAKLLEENRRLGVSLANHKEMMEANLKLEEENQKLRAGMGMMQELMNENNSLQHENNHLLYSMHRCLEDNRQLSDCISRTACIPEDGFYDFPQGPQRSPLERAAMAALEVQEIEKRQRKLAEEMRYAQEQHERDLSRRQLLGARVIKELKAFENAKASAPAGEQHRVPSTAMARLSILTHKASQLSSKTVSSWKHSLDESLRRVPGRRDPDVIRADLSRKIDALGRGHLEGPMPPVEATEKQLELERLQQADVDKAADAQVRQAFFEYAGDDDLLGFMAALGYEGFNPTGPVEDEAELLDIFQLATTSTLAAQIDPTKPAMEKALAAATNRYLQEWYAQYSCC